MVRTQVNTVDFLTVIFEAAMQGVTVNAEGWYRGRGVKVIKSPDRWVSKNPALPLLQTMTYASHSPLFLHC